MWQHTYLKNGIARIPLQYKYKIEELRLSIIKVLYGKYYNLKVLYVDCADQGHDGSFDAILGLRSSLFIKKWEYSSSIVLII